MLEPRFTSDCAARLCFGFSNKEEDSQAVSVVTGHYCRAKGQAEVTGGVRLKLHHRVIQEPFLSMASAPARAHIHTCCPAREEGAAHSVKGKRYVKVGALPSVTDRVPHICVCVCVWGG